MIDPEEWLEFYGWGFGVPVVCKTCRRTPAENEVDGVYYCDKCATVARGHKAWCPNCKRGLDKDGRKCILCKGEGTLDYA